MIKASEGGGGKGVRKATSKDQIETMYQQVRAPPRGLAPEAMRCVRALVHRDCARLRATARDCARLRATARAGGILP
eukprot:1091765-Prymnesium_polylepis.1